MAKRLSIYSAHQALALLLNDVTYLGTRLPFCLVQTQSIFIHIGAMPLLLRVFGALFEIRTAPVFSLSGICTPG